MNVQIFFPDLVEAAAEDPNGRIALRTPTGMVSFFSVGDGLEARVTEAQANYLAKIEGFHVEGRESKPLSKPEIDDWNKEGERLYKLRKHGETQQVQQQDPFAMMVALLGGPEKVQALLAGALTAQAGTVAQTAQQQAEEKQIEMQRVQAKREAALGWTYPKLLKAKLKSDDVVELLATFDPAFNIDGKHINAMLSRLAKLANENHVLADRLSELTA